VIWVKIKRVKSSLNGMCQNRICLNRGDAFRKPQSLADREKLRALFDLSLARDPDMVKFCYKVADRDTIVVDPNRDRTVRIEMAVQKDRQKIGRWPVNDTACRLLDMLGRNVECHPPAL
jgi:hypothetical protein